MSKLTQLQDQIILTGLKRGLSRKEILEKLIIQRDTAKLTLAESDKAFARQTFKRSVMTVSSYDAKFTSVRKNVLTEMSKTNFLKVATKDQISRFSMDIYNQISISMESSTSYKMFARNMLKEALRDDIVSFNAPLTGFPVRLKINQFEKRKIKYIIPSTKKQAVVCLMEDTGIIDKRKTVTSSVPSIIHSIDAAILIRTRCDFGLPMTTIHDSFGTHAENISLLKTSINSVLIELYEADALQDIADQIQFYGKVPCFDLDDSFIEVIRSSKYGFN